MQLKSGNTGRCLEENLATFVELLRQEGLPAGTPEIVDALRALQRVDLSSRGEFKTALQAALVKSRRDQPLFSQIFDRFFASAEEHGRLARELSDMRKDRASRLDQASRELHFRGAALKLSADELDQYTALAPDHRNRLRGFVQRTENGVNVEERFRPILENIVKSHLRYCRGRDEKHNRAVKVHGSGGLGCAGGAGSGPAGEELLREIDIEAIKASDLSAAEQLMHNISRRLAIKIVRRRRRGPRKGPPDLRRSMRDNMRFGGLVFSLKQKHRRRTRQQIVLLCDVSASMKNYSSFVITFMHGLQSAVKDLHCFNFSDKLEDLSAELRGRSSLKQVLDRVIRRSQTWGGGTDIGNALRRLAENYPHLLNARTTVMVVSDTKTVTLEMAAAELEKLGELVKRVIWLNPLPVKRWPDYRSVNKLAEHAEMWPCSTIAQLEKALTGRF